MKLRSMTSVAVLALSGVASHAALAAIPDGEVHFSGKVVDTTCTNKGMNYVNLGTLALKDGTMTEQGAKGVANRFYIELENCSTATKKNASVKFSGTADTTYGGGKLLAIDIGAGKAKGVAIEIADDQATQVLGADSRDFPIADGANKLPFDARFVRTAAKGDTGLQAGDVTAAAEFNITYK